MKSFLCFVVLFECGIHNARSFVLKCSPQRSERPTRFANVQHHPRSLNPRLSTTVLHERQQEGLDPHTSSESSGSWLLPLVVPLWLIYISNQWSRSSIYYLVDFSSTATEQTAMNVALQFDESQYAIVASIAFTSLFAVASVVLGNAVDQPNFDRRLWTIASCLVWSVTVLYTALFADSYASLVASRFLMGIACAATTPTAYTWIRDKVPQAQSATAASIYGTGVALGSGAASLTLLLDAQVGWRQTMTGIGATGLLAAVLAAAVLPQDGSPVLPDQGKEEVPGNSSGILDDVMEAFSSERAQWIFLACLFRFGSGLCIGVWSAPFFRSVLSSDDLSQYAVAQAAISAVCASVSGVLGGKIADRLSTNAGVEQRLWVPVVGSLLAAPAWYFAVEAAPESFGLSMSWLALEYLVAECWFGPTISTLQATVGSKVGGTAQGLFTMTGAVANLAPTLVGYVLADNLSDLLSESVCISYVASALCFVMAIQASPPVIDEQTNP